MAYATKLVDIVTDASAVDGLISYATLATLLKSALAVAIKDGLPLVSIQLPTGQQLNYGSVADAATMLVQIERLAGEEGGGFFPVCARLA